MIDITLWEELAANWCRFVSDQTGETIKNQTKNSVEAALAELDRYGTRERIPSLLDIIFSDDDDIF
jgi:hypothetical protein